MCVDNPLRGKRSAAGREGVGGYSATKPSLSSRLAKQLDAEKFIGEQLRSPQPPMKKPDDSLVERRLRRRVGSVRGCHTPLWDGDDGDDGDVAHFCVIEAI